LRQHVEDDRRVLAGNRHDHERVEQLVVPERGRGGVRSLAHVHDRADRVGDPSREQQQRRDQPDPFDDLREDEHGGPAERNADRRCDPCRRPGRDELDDGRQAGASPNRGEDGHAPVAMQDEKPDRRVRPGDQRVDHGVVEATETLRDCWCPGAAVEDAADAEHPSHAQRERRRRRARNTGVRRDRDGGRGGHGGEEGNLVRYAAEPRPRTSVAGTCNVISHGAV